MKHLKELIKEAQDIRINEHMEHSKLWDKFEEFKEVMGTDELLDAIAQALSTDELENNLRYIDRCHDLGIM